MLLEEKNNILNTKKEDKDKILNKIRKKITEMPIVDKEKIHLCKKKKNNPEFWSKSAQRIADKILHFEEMLFRSSLMQRNKQNDN